LARLEVYLFVFVVLFQLITLPIEFGASHRALRVLKDNNILIGGELKGAEKVLRATALTYIAALFASVFSYCDW
jgi:predicted Zn-dependent protease